MNRPAVLVTGGAKRLGAEISRRFGDAGWHVVVHYRSSAKEAVALAATLPSAEIVQCDLADDEAAVAMVEALATRLDDWRCLVSNASVFEADTADRLDPGFARRAYVVNSMTPLRMAQTYFAHAQSPSGRRLVQLTDQKLAHPNPDFFSYSMSKYAVDGGAQMLAMARAPDDRIYCLAPGAILASHDQSNEEAEISHRLNLLRRRTEASEVADAALFLAEGPLTNGSTLIVDSGQHLLDQRRDVIYLARGGSAA